MYTRRNQTACEGFKKNPLKSQGIDEKTTDIPWVIIQANAQISCL